MCLWSNAENNSIIVEWIPKWSFNDVEAYNVYLLYIYSKSSEIGSIFYIKWPSKTFWAVSLNS